MKKILFIVVLSSILILSWCGNNNQQTKSENKISNDKKIWTTTENIIEDESKKSQQWRIPDCDWIEWVPFEWFSSAELQQMWKSTEEILEYGKSSNDAIYCRKKAWLSNDKIVSQLKEYGLSETEVQDMIVHSK
jgi:hypothetical protein